VPPAPLWYERPVDGPFADGTMAPCRIVLSEHLGAPTDVIDVTRGRPPAHDITDGSRS
jgi:hypothetical protein